MSNTIIDSDSTANVSQELVTLLRGFYATPIICALGRHGFWDIARVAESFTLDDFPSIQQKSILKSSFDYLSRVGLLDCLDGKDHYRLNDLGRQIFQRLSSFYPPHSYRDFVHDFTAKLSAKEDGSYPPVDRLENIIGSGRTHQRYFPAAISFLKRKVQFDWIVDIGCGDGGFLDLFLNSIPKVNALGVDLSEVSVRETAENLKIKHPSREVFTFCSDAADVNKWGAFVDGHVVGKSLAFSMWFLLHEISRNEPDRVIRFLKEVHQRFPNAPIAVGELVRQTPALLAKERDHLIMPEYLFFHDMSGQGVLTWKEYNDVLSQIPYKLAYARLYDEIGSVEGQKEPATFVWCLLPQS